MEKPVVKINVPKNGTIYPLGTGAITSKSRIAGQAFVLNLRKSAVFRTRGDAAHPFMHNGIRQGGRAKRRGKGGHAPAKSEANTSISELFDLRKEKRVSLPDGEHVIFLGNLKGSNQPHRAKRTDL